jgi:hypothetical protein
MKVRATQMGYYDLKRRREGDVFEIKTEKEFSSKWMEKLDSKSARSRKPKEEVESDDLADASESVI